MVGEIRNAVTQVSMMKCCEVDIRTPPCTVLSGSRGYVVPWLCPVSCASEHVAIHSTRKCQQHGL